MELANKYKLKVTFAGSSNKTIVKLRNKIRINYPDLIICETVSPPLNFENNQLNNIEVIQKIKASKPDVLFLALGSPRQEMWLYKNKEEIGAKINVGVGAAFDFYSGTKKRSPEFLQKLGFEWVWRLFNEPGRLFKRYIIRDLPFFIKEYLKIKFSL